MQPYFHEHGVTLYHGDCLEILPELAKADLVLTDPPYGIRKWNSSGGQSLSEAEAEAVNKWDALPSQDLMDAVVDAGRYAIVWGGNYLCGLLGAFRTPLVWDKKIRGMHFAEGEMAWTNFDFGTLRIFEHPIAGNWGSPLSGKRHREHPTQKPVELMQWCIQKAKLGGKEATVIDPFAGSGTTLEAAQNLGLSAIGIELEERYCEVVAKRFDQGRLFV